jgi:hypothetical protein
VSTIHAYYPSPLQLTSSVLGKITGFGTEFFRVGGSRAKSRRSNPMVCLAVILATISLLLVGCYGQRGNIEAIAEAYSKALKLNSFRFELLQEVVLPNVALPVLYEMKGAYSYPDKLAAEITTHVGPEVKAFFVVIRFGRGYFVKLPAETRLLFPGTKEWIAGGLQEIKRTAFFGLLPEEVQDISQTISFLSAASDDVSLRDYTALEKKGLNYIRHYVFALDTEKLSRGHTRGEFGLFVSGGGEVWLDIDSLIRQLHVVLLGPAKAGGASRVDAKASIYDHNEEVSIRVPRQEEITPFEEFKRMFPSYVSQ